MKKVGAAKGRLGRLIRKGIVRPGRAQLSESFFAEPRPRLKRGASVVAALIEERREGSFAERGAGADIPKALRILKRAGVAQRPMKGDELSGSKRKRR